MAFGKHVGTDKHHRSHDLHWQWGSHADDAGQDHIARELAGLLGGDLLSGQRAEAGVDTIDHFASVANRGRNPVMGLAHALLDLITQRSNGRAMPAYGDDILDGQCLTG